MQIEQEEKRRKQLSARGESQVTFSTAIPSSSSSALNQRRSLPSITVETENGTSSTVQPKSTNPDFIASEQQKLKNSFRYVREYINPKHRSSFTRDRYREFKRTYRVFDRDEDGIVTANDLSSFLQWGEQKTVDIARMMKHLYGSEQMSFPQFINLMMDNEHIFEEFLNGTRSLKSIEKLSMAMYGGMKSSRKKRRRNKFVGRKHGLVMTREDLQIIKHLKQKQKEKDVTTRKRKVRQQVMKRLIPEKMRLSGIGSGYGEETTNRSSEGQYDRSESPQRRPNTVGTQRRVTTATRQRRLQNGSRPQTTPFSLRQASSNRFSLHDRSQSPSSQFSPYNTAGSNGGEYTYAPNLNNSSLRQMSPHRYPSSMSRLEEGDDMHPFAVPVQQTRLHSVYAPGGTTLLNSKDGRHAQTSSFNHRSPQQGGGSFPQSRKNTRLRQLSKKTLPVRNRIETQPLPQAPPKEEDGFDTERRRQFYARLRKNNPYVNSPEETFEEFEKSLQEPQSNASSAHRMIQQSGGDVSSSPARRGSNSARVGTASGGRRRRSSLKITSARQLAKADRYEMTPTPELLEKPMFKTLDSAGII